LSDERIDYLIYTIYEVTDRDSRIGLDGKASYELSDTMKIFGSILLLLSLAGIALA